MYDLTNDPLLAISWMTCALILTAGLYRRYYSRVVDYFRKLKANREERKRVKKMVNTLKVGDRVRIKEGVIPYGGLIGKTVYLSTRGEFIEVDMDGELSYFSYKDIEMVPFKSGEKVRARNKSHHAYGKTLKMIECYPNPYNMLWASDHEGVQYSFFAHELELCEEEYDPLDTPNREVPMGEETKQAGDSGEEDTIKPIYDFETSHVYAPYIPAAHKMIEKTRELIKENKGQKEMSKLKVGDKVRIKFWDDPNVRPDPFHPQMDNTQGKIGTLFGSSLVKFDDGDRWYYYDDQYELYQKVDVEVGEQLLKSPEAKDTPKEVEKRVLKIGDKVRVKEWTKPKRPCSWNREGKMDWTIGTIGTVVREKSRPFNLRVKFDDESTWTYLRDELEYIEPALLESNKTVYVVPSYPEEKVEYRPETLIPTGSGWGTTAFIGSGSCGPISRSKPWLAHAGFNRGLVNKLDVGEGASAEEVCNIEETIVEKQKDGKSYIPSSKVPMKTTFLIDVGSISPREDKMGTLVDYIFKNNKKSTVKIVRKK